MKFTSQVSAAFASLGLLAAASAQDLKFSVPGASSSTPPAKAPATTAPAAPASAPVAAPAAPKATAKYTDTQIIEAYGWIAGQQLGLRQLEFSKSDIEALARGMIAMASDAKPTFDPQAMEPELQAFMKRKAEVFEKKRDAYLNDLKTKNMADAAAFFTKLKENKNVVELPSGLRYEILKPATGALPKAGQIATINYTGAFLNGDVFDTSAERKEPAELLLVAASAENPNGAIPGMIEGLLKIGVGGKVRLYIPPHLAYGDTPNQVIPPGSTLVFEVEIVSVKDAPKTPAVK